jgi:hypothetical protein
MFAQWLRKIFAPKTRPLAGRRQSNRSAHPRSFRPELFCLEDRLAPAAAAIFALSGTTLTYAGTSTSNVIQVSGSAGSLTIHDLTGTITSTVAGFTGNGTNTVTGTIPSNALSLTIVGGAGATSVTFANGFSTTRSVTVSATSIVTAGTVTTAAFTATGTAIQLGGNLNTNAGPIGGNAAFNGTVITTAPVTITTASVVNGNVTFNGVVSSSNSLTINAGNTGTVLETGTTTLINTANFTISNAGSITLGATTVNGNVLLEAQGGIKLLGPLNENNAADSVVIAANEAGAGANGFTQSAGSITTAGTSVTITVGGTAYADIQSITTAAGGNVFISTGGGIPDVNGSAVNINTGLDGTAILLAGYPGISLDTEVGTVFATVTGSLYPYTSPISIRNTGQPLTVEGATTTYGAVTITNNDNITVAGPITASGPSGLVILTATANLTDSSNVVINNGAEITSLGGSPTGSTYFIPGKVTITTPGSITGGSVVAISSPSVLLNANTGISGTAGPFNTSLPIDTDTVSATTNTGGIGLISVTANRTLTVTNATANGGAVTITTPYNGSPNGNDLNITGLVTAGGAITLEAGDSLNVGEFATIVTPTTITLDAEQNLQLQAGSVVAATGNIQFNDGASFPLGINPAVISLAGSVTSAGSVTINGSGSNGGNPNSDVISVTGAISATGGLFVDVGTGANVLILVPSQVTPYTINLPAAAHSGNTIIIDALASSVASATSAGVTFTLASGYQSWTINNFSSAEGDTIPPYV